MALHLCYIEYWVYMSGMLLAVILIVMYFGEQREMKHEASHKNRWNEQLIESELQHNEDMQTMRSI